MDSWASSNIEMTRTRWYIYEKKILPDGFTPKSKRSRRIFSFCKRVNRMVSWAIWSA